MIQTIGNTIVAKRNLLDYYAPSIFDFFLSLSIYVESLSDIYVYLCSTDYLHFCFSIFSFLKLYNRDGVELIGLDDAATRLGLDLITLIYIYDLFSVFY